MSGISHVHGCSGALVVVTKHMHNFVRISFTFVLSLVKVLFHLQPKPPLASACICNDGADFHLEQSETQLLGATLFRCALHQN